MEKLLDPLLAETTFWAPRLGGVIAIGLIFWVLAQVSRRLITRACRKFAVQPNLASLLGRTSSITLLVFGLITALGTLGINVSALVAGLGLTGFALGFALKDIISNLLSGVLILLYQPFRNGDAIKVSGFEGEVVSIDLRYTELNNQGIRILLPNSKLFTDPITVLQPQDQPANPVSAP